MCLAAVEVVDVHWGNSNLQLLVLHQGTSLLEVTHLESPKHTVIYQVLVHHLEGCLVKGNQPSLVYFAVKDGLVV